MYQRVLLAYDGTREGRSALREGAMVARRFGSRVFLLCVVPDMAGGRLAEGGASVAGAQEAYQELFDEAMTWTSIQTELPPRPTESASFRMRNS